MYYSSKIISLLLLILFTGLLVASCRQSKQTVVHHSGTKAHNRGVNYFKVSDFFDDKKSDREILQDLFDQNPDNSSRVTYDLEGFEFNIDGTIYYHKASSRITTIEGHGARIQAEGDFDILVPDQGLNYKIGRGGEKDIMSVFDAVKVRDVDFSNGRTQLRIVGTYQSEVSGCRFFRGTRGLQVIFGLQTLISHCEFVTQRQESCVLRSGLSDETLFKSWNLPIDESDKGYFENGNGSNSQSNRSIVEHCRFIGYQGQKVCLRVQASDEVQANNCIFEGFPVMYSIYYDNRGSTTTRAFQVNYPHIEHGHPDHTRALIYVRGGFAEIRGLYPQYGDITYIESDAAQVYVERPRYLVWSDSTFVENGGGKWSFESEVSSEKLGDPKHWKGTLPGELVKRSISNTEYFGKNGGFIKQGRSGAGFGVASYNSNDGLVDFSQEKGKSSVFKHSFESYYDTHNTLYNRPKNLTDYQISFMMPVKMKDTNGEMKTVYIPYFSSK